MIPAPFFLSVEQIKEIHARVIKEFGGDTRLRDAGLLESAAMMPAAHFAGRFLHKDIPTMAAAYLFHICKNHAFADGNKRTALVAAEVFLQLNGHQLRATNRELERLTWEVAVGKIGKEAVEVFMEDHVSEVQQD
jgi:death on curing protein